MNREQKSEVVKSLRDGFLSSHGSFLVKYRGLTVSQIQVLRARLRQNGGQLKVAKARLMKRAAENLPFADELAPYFKDQIGVVFAIEKSPEVAKVLYESSKTHESLELIAGCMEQRAIDKSLITAIAILPPKEVLLGQVCAAMSAPLTGFVGILNMLTIRPLLVLNQIAKKK